jgi:hypothetical protein
MFDTKTTAADEVPFDLLPAWTPPPVIAEDKSQVEAMVESMIPGPEMASFLLAVDRDSLSGHDRVVLLKARARFRSWIDAELLADIHAVSSSTEEWVRTELVDGDIHDVFYATAAEVEAALTLTRRAAEFQTEGRPTMSAAPQRLAGIT